MSESSASGLGRSNLHALYRALCLTRAAEERLALLHGEGHVTGDVYSGLGQEAGSVGAAYALRRRNDGSGDFLAPNSRAAGAIFLFGGALADFFRQYMARATGPTGGRGARVHWFDLQRGFVGPVAPLGTMLEVMAGVTLSFKLRGEERVGIVFCGEGASSTGAWHEGLCFAAVQQCPLVIIVESFQGERTSVSRFTEMAPGYGIGVGSVEGTDVLAVFEAVRRAAARARAGGGTQMVELRYLRRSAPTHLDSRNTLDPGHDSIGLFRVLMLGNEWASEPELVAIEEEEFERSRGAAERAIAEPLARGPDAVENVYSDVAIARPWARADTPDPALAR